mgnify:CR=1 FL=1
MPHFEPQGREYPTGVLYWLTGLAGAGKTTLGHLLFEEIRTRRPQSVFLDGDVLRKVFDIEGGTKPAERLQLAMRYARLCRDLTAQDIDVVCCTISLFPEVWNWNRENIPSYREIYVRVPMDVLKQRDKKGLYSSAESGEVQNVVGVDLPFNEPVNPDLIVDNDGTSDPATVVSGIVSALGACRP